MPCYFSLTNCRVAMIAIMEAVKMNISVLMRIPVSVLYA